MLWLMELVLVCRCCWCASTWVNRDDSLRDLMVDRIWHSACWQWWVRLAKNRHILINYSSGLDFHLSLWLNNANYIILQLFCLHEITINN